MLTAALTAAQPPAAAPRATPAQPAPAAQPVVPPSLRLFSSADGKVSQDLMMTVQESFPVTVPVTKIQDGKPVTVNQTQMMTRTKTVSRPEVIDPKDVQFRTVGGAALTYEQAAERVKGGAVCAVVYSFQKLDERYLKAFKDDVIVATLTPRPAAPAAMPTPAKPVSK